MKAKETHDIKKCVAPSFETNGDDDGAERMRKEKNESKDQTEKSTQSAAFLLDALSFSREIVCVCDLPLCVSTELSRGRKRIQVVGQSIKRANDKNHSSAARTHTQGKRDREEWRGCHASVCGAYIMISHETKVVPRCRCFCINFALFLSSFKHLQFKGVPATQRHRFILVRNLFFASVLDLSIYSRLIAGPHDAQHIICSPRI